ncbi:MAG: TonB-dependent receptor [Acidobacteria bacterium]|nr:TonB-dependent receptor [Acidobacteriota bacterium]
MRSRTSIQNFFRRGATVRGLVASGPDATYGTADDTLIATGETLAQVQTRVLGTAASAPLFPYIPGFATFGLRGGFRLGEGHEVIFDLENLNDRNYRGISWGMDAPGRSFGLRYRYRF